MEKVPGIIVILHNGFSKITVDESLQALPADWLSLNREVVEISYSELLELQKLYDTGYAQYALEHRRQFVAVVAPLLAKYPGYKIVYFGLAPIPLCIDFGHLFHNYRDISIYQKHHVTKVWYTDPAAGVADEKTLRIEGVPGTDQKGIVDAMIRLATSHPVNPEDTIVILPNAAEIDIAIDHTDEDVTGTDISLKRVGEAVKRVMDDLSNNRSNIDVIHLFAAIPCGIAFLVGTKISPNIHSFIQTYQFSRTREPKYTKALLIKGPLEVERKATEEELQRSNYLRDLADKELQKGVRKYCGENEDMSSGRSWVKAIVPKLPETIMNSPFWKDLPAMYETTLSGDSFETSEEVISDGFLWRLHKWYVDDGFFIALDKRIKAEAEILSAVRLFLFHEALHYKKHRLTDLTSVNIGSFPKVLEIADYQADVYALMNEYGYHSKMIGAITDPKAFFLKAIMTATETMWSFDDNGQRLEEIQIRRLNRYLNWYWQYARIESDGNDINDIISILEEKPVIELNGLKSKEENNRFFFLLEKRPNQPLELAVFYNNQLVRDGSATNMVIEVLVQGVKEMKGEMILPVLRSFLIR
jgi:hypothetical protein